MIRTEGAGQGITVPFPPCTQCQQNPPRQPPRMSFLLTPIIFYIRVKADCPPNPPNLNAQSTVNAGDRLGGTPKTIWNSTCSISRQEHASMMDLICQTFVIAVLFFYSALSLALVGWTIQGVLESRRRRARMARTPERFQELALSPQTHRN